MDRRLQEAQGQLQIVQAAWASLAIEGPEAVEQAANGVRTALQSMHTTLLAWQDAPLNASDGNVYFVERHAVEVTTLSERLGTFTSAARVALDNPETSSSGRS